MIGIRYARGLDWYDLDMLKSCFHEDAVLDYGCGSGTYARMFPDIKWDGVEVWEPYVEQYGLNDLYATIDTSDARECTFIGDWDVAIAGDVLEHMTADEAKTLLAKLQRQTQYVIVSIPLGH